MATHKKLISYNTEKHPEVDNFFKELEDTNLTSHYVREAIKFYLKYKNKPHATEPIQSHTKKNTENDNILKDTENEYEDFNPNDVLGI